MVKVDSKHDFILLSTIERTPTFQIYPHILRSPRNLEWFLGFGLSDRSTDGSSHIADRSGRMVSLEPDKKGRFKTDAAIGDGDSG